MLKAMFAFTLALGLSAVAQANDQIIVNLPVQVQMQDKVLEPGQYVIRELNNHSGSTGVLGIFKGQELETLVATNSAEDPATAPKSMVTLQQVGNDFYLSKVWVQGKRNGYQLILPAAAESRMQELRVENPSVSSPVETREVNLPASRSTEATGR